MPVVPLEALEALEATVAVVVAEVVKAAESPNILTVFIAIPCRKKSQALSSDVYYYFFPFISFPHGIGVVELPDLTGAGGQCQLCL